MLGINPSVLSMRRQSPNRAAAEKVPSLDAPLLRVRAASSQMVGVDEGNSAEMMSRADSAGAPGLQRHDSTRSSPRLLSPISPRLLVESQEISDTPPAPPRRHGSLSPLGRTESLSGILFYTD